MIIPLSVLDLAPISSGETAADSIAGSVALARRAEESGYARVWYAEHHNMATIASSATSVLIAHVAAPTSTIRLGAGGVMLPNHAPLVIAEQYGTLEAMHPGRIDLGLGRAPGSDQATMRALRRTPGSANDFPRDVLELQDYLNHESGPGGVRAVPGGGSRVPLYILGSSLFGAQLAASMGLPYAFASHFAPALLDEALATYRNGFRPSAQLEAPFVMVGVNVVAATSWEEAHRTVDSNRRAFVRSTLSGAKEMSDYELGQLLRRGGGRHFDALYSNMAVGGAAEVADYLRAFHARTAADEIITAHQAPSIHERLTSVAITAESVRASNTASR